MKRWHDDYKITLREWKKHRQTHIDSNKSQSAYRIGKKADEIDCVCDLQIDDLEKWMHLIVEIQGAICVANHLKD